MVNALLRVRKIERWPFGMRMERENRRFCKVTRHWCITLRGVPTAHCSRHVVLTIPCVFGKQMERRRLKYSVTRALCTPRHSVPTVSALYLHRSTVQLAFGTSMVRANLLYLRTKRACMERHSVRMGSSSSRVLSGCLTGFGREHGFVLLVLCGVQREICRKFGPTRLVMANGPA